MNDHRFTTLCGVLILASLGSLSTCAADVPANLDTDPHLVGWWKFDETAGKSAADSSAKKHDATLAGELSFETHSADGKVGKALRLEGKGEVVVTGYKGVPGTQQRTVAMWIKGKNNDGELVSWGFRDAGKMFTMCFIRSRVGVTPKGGYLYMKARTDDDQWHHVVAVVREASPPNLHDDVKIYKDGGTAEIDDIGLLDLWPIDTGDKEDVSIGKRFKGLIDDVRIYDRALSDDEVAALFKRVSGPVPAKP